MTRRQWKYRFYEEEELDIDDILDDTDDNDTPEDFSTGDEDISSQIKTLVSREVKRLPPGSMQMQEPTTSSPTSKATAAYRSARKRWWIKPWMPTSGS